MSSSSAEGIPSSDELGNTDFIDAIPEGLEIRRPKF
jgi:hypothetical protein